MAFPSPEKWEPGIYFGLPEDIYHSLPWLGSGDVKTLASIPQDYWDGSAMNPLRTAEELDEKDTAAKLFGRAIHTCILNGEPEYLRRYGFIENDTTKSGPSAAGLKQWIEAQGAEPRKLKEDNLKYIKDTWGVEMLTERQDKQIRMASRSILSNPYLAQAFDRGFSEVSIFWTDPETGAPCKARLDYLKINTTVDLKSIRKQGTRLLAFHQMCLKAIFQDYRYDVQAAHYNDGRRAARSLLEAGKVFWPDTPGFQRPAEEWLARCFNTDAGWAFVFYKASGAPIARSVQCGPGGYMLTSGISMMKLGRQNYMDFMERYGTNVWVDAGEPIDADTQDAEKYWSF